MRGRIGRRDMLRKCLGAAAGISLTRCGALSGTTLLAEDSAAPPESVTAATELDGMPVRTLGKTGHQVPLFSLGGETTVEQRARTDDAVAIINKALDSGVNFIDTSHIYGRGGSEENIGDVMADRREEVFLATKTGRRDYDGAMRECEISLRRLQTDYIDLYQHHHVNNNSALNQILAEDGALKAFKQLRAEGVIRHIGITSHSPRIMIDALNSYDYESALITLNPAGMSMMETEYMDGFFQLARAKDVGVIGMKVAGKGNIFQRGITMPQAMSYTLSFPVATVIVGVTHPEQIDENVEIACNFRQLEDAEIKAIEDSV